MIRNFTTERYLSTAYQAREWEKIWTRVWLLAGVEQDVREPGQFFTFEIGPESIVVSRSAEGRLVAHYNVCQHRGNRLVAECLGRTDRFRCAYHSWTYDVDGRLRSVPDAHRFGNGLPFDALALKPVKVDTWAGMVFVNMDPEAEPLAEFLAPIPEELKGYRFADMLVTQDQTVTHNCNWKAIIDNFSELYHVDFIHPQHKSMVDCWNATVDLLPHGHTAVRVQGGTVNPRYPIPDEPTDILKGQLVSLGLDPADFRGRVPDIRRAIQRRKRAVGPERGLDFSELSDDQLSDVWQFNLFPNIILSFSAEALWIMRVRPDARDPERCAFDKLSLTLFPKEDARTNGHATSEAPRHFVLASERAKDYRRPARDFFDHDEIIAGRKSMDITIDQDIHLLGNVQAGMRSRGFNRVWLNDDESRVQHFHDAVDAYLEVR